jgi:hypothetical protein
MRHAMLFLGGLALAVMLATGCDAMAPVGNDPVPLPADLAAMIGPNMGLRLSPADGSVPQISATKAVAIAGEHLFEELDGNRVPRQDPSVPDGLVRRLMTDGSPQHPKSVWIVAYRWAAGFDCHSPAGGPGPCESTSFYFIDDRTGELITSYGDTRE